MTAHSCRIAFFDAKPYDRDSFNSVNEREFHYDIRYFKGHLTPDSVPLTHGTDVACIFVNDTANREVIRNLKENDLLYDDIACGMLIKKLQYEKRDLLESMEMFYRVFFLGE